MQQMLLSEAEAATALRLSARTLRKLRNDGLIRYVALTGRRIAYRLQDLEAFVQARLKENQPCQPPKKPGRRARGNRSATNVVPFTQRADVRPAARG